MKTDGGTMCREGKQNPNPKGIRIVKNQLIQ